MRRWAVALTTAGVMLGPAAAAAAAPHASATASADAFANARVVLIAVPDLRWSDLADMPRLSAYSAASAVGDLASRAESTAARCADGSLTLAAGNRASAGGTTACTLSLGRYLSLRDSLMHDRYGADIAAFGDALAVAGITTNAAGPAASVLLADRHGVAGHMAGAEVDSVVDSQLYDAAVPRPVADQQLDQALSLQLKEIPSSATVVVAGTSDAATGGPALHVLLLHGPGWRHVQLTSASTDAKYVQSVDIAPSILSWLHVAVPSSMIGGLIRPIGNDVPSAAHYVDVNRHAQASDALGGLTRSVFGVSAMLALLLAALAFRRGSTRLFGAAMAISSVAVWLPLASYVIQLAPWWRHGRWVYWLGLAVGCLAMAAITIGLGFRRGRPATALLAMPVTAVVLIVDQLAGAPLQDAAPLGNQPLVAGRFDGMGNIAFAAMCGAAVFTAAVLGDATRRRRGARAAALVGGGICVLAAIVDAAPSLGDDFGGLLAMAPTTILVMCLLAGVRLSARRVPGVVVAVAIIAVGLSLADYARPASKQTHIGTFAGEVIHGRAGRTIRRKLYSDVHSFGNVAVTGSVVLLVLVVVLCREQVGRLVADQPAVRTAAIALVVLAVVGVALNDSGIVIAEFALLPAALCVLAATKPAVVSGLASRRAPLPTPPAAPAPT